MRLLVRARTRLRSASLFGIEASLVEVDVSFGLPAFNMVGLLDSSVRESRDRVRSAIRNSGFEFPAHRVTINLAPANVRKRVTSYDLPIAVGVLAASGLLPRREYGDILLLGELSLDGTIQSIRGVLPMALVARQHALRLLAPPATAPEAAMVKGLDTGVVRSLAEVVGGLEGRLAPPPPASTPRPPKHGRPLPVQTCGTFVVNGSGVVRWRWPRLDDTTCSSSDHPVPERP